MLDETGEDGPQRSRMSTRHLLDGCTLCLVPPFEDMTVEQIQVCVCVCVCVCDDDNDDDDDDDDDDNDLALCRS